MDAFKYLLIGIINMLMVILVCKYVMTIYHWSTVSNKYPGFGDYRVLVSANFMNRQADKH